MNIFISYKSSDSAFVQELVTDLEDMGHNPWYDQDLSGGQKWWDNILENIRNCDVLIFAITPHSIHSRACHLEYNYANDLNKPILPVLMAKGVNVSLLPVILQERQLIDYIIRDKEAFKSVERSLRSVPPPSSLPEPLPDPPPLPISPLATLRTELESPVLSRNQQLDILLQLKGFLTDPEYGNDARELLRRMREHPSLLASILKEIDALPDPVIKPDQPLPPVDEDTLPTNVDLREGEQFVKAIRSSLLRGFYWLSVKLTITTQRLIFKVSQKTLLIDQKFLLEIPLNTIAELKSEWKWLAPAVAIRTKKGERYYFTVLSSVWYGNRDEIISLIKGLIPKAEIS